MIHVQNLYKKRKETTTTTGIPQKLHKCRRTKWKIEIVAADKLLTKLPRNATTEHVPYFLSIHTFAQSDKMEGRKLDCLRKEKSHKKRKKRIKRPEG
jgi:hypothetical protein